MIQALVHDLTLLIDAYEGCRADREAMIAAREYLIRRRAEILEELENGE